MVSSLIPAVVATLGAVAMALAFPRTNAVALAPIGAAALFWAWFGMPPKRAFWTGMLAGTAYFAITFWWFGETAGALIAPFGFLLALGPAVGDAFFGFALAGALVSFAAAALGHPARAVRAAVPVACAAVFAFAEWFRSEGLGEIGVPFGSLGYTQVASPLGAVAAYAGTYGVTFVVCAIGAYVAYALRMRAVRASGVDAAAGLGALALLVACAWTFWPARAYPSPTFPVAAIQGDIQQGLKFAPGALERAIATYESLSRTAAATHPKLVVWPETVIPVDFDRAPSLHASFGTLARSLDATIVVGTYAIEPNGEYNMLASIAPDGTLESTYRKRQLVPFAEHIPFRPLFAWIPWTSNVSNFAEGGHDALTRAGGLRFGPIVCWESAFSEIVRSSVRDGADALIVATDDAWFGTTAGPYQHAQIAQMRAIETGRWIVRAASTGISGIIAPDGRFAERSGLGEAAVVSGEIGAPVTTIYDAVGAPAVAIVLAATYAAFLVWSRRRRPAR